MNELTAWAKEYFANDKYATEITGIEIVNVEKGASHCRLELKNGHYNAAGNVLGGVLFTIADFASAISSQSEGDSTVSVSSNITYLSATKDNVIFADAENIKSGRSTVTVEVDVSDSHGKLLAKIITTNFKVGKQTK